MLAIELKKYLEGLPDKTNILVYVASTGEVRQLLKADMDRNADGNIIIDAEYSQPSKVTVIDGNWLEGEYKKGAR